MQATLIQDSRWKGGCDQWCLL